MDSKFKSLRCTARGALVLVGGMLVHLALGTVFTFGNLSPYIISYLRNRTDDTELHNVDIMWVTSIGAVTNCFAMTGGGLLDKIFGPRIATGVGAAIFSAAIAATGLTIKKSYVLVVLTYGVFAMLGNNMAYGPPVQTAIKWFPSRPSLATGLIVAGYGGGALVFNQVITNFINPENVPPDLTAEDGDRYFTDPDLLDRVPTCFFILGASYAVLQLIGITMINAPPTDDKHSSNVNANHSANIGTDNKAFENCERTAAVKYLKHEGESVQLPETTAVQKATKEYTTKEAVIKMFKTRSFYIIFFSVFFEATGLQFVLGLYKAYGQTFIQDDRFLALVGSFTSVFNCLGRPVWGLFIDKFKYKSCAQVLGGVFAMTLKSTIGWRGLFYLAGALNTIPFILTFLFNGKDLNGRNV